MLRILLVLANVALASAHEGLIQLEHASFTISDLQGTIPQHFATLRKNPSLISTYAHRMHVYHIKQISEFTKLFVSSPEYHLHLIKLPLKKIKKSWITAASAGRYQVIERTSNASLPQKIYVFLGYAEGEDPRADSLVNSFKERLDRFRN